MKNKRHLQYIAVLFCCTALMLCAYGENAYGYAVSKTSGGAEIKWPVASANFYINASGGPSGALEAVKAALQTWTDVSTSNFNFVYSGETSSTAYGQNDGTNIVCFGALGSGYESTIALNTYWASVSLGTLVDSDIKLNTVFSFATDSSAGAYDVQSIALHELGHALSLADLYNTSDSAKVMYGYGSLGEVKRVLDQDDKDGITYLYGGSVGTTTTVSGGGGGSTTTIPVTSSTRTTIITDPDSYGECPSAVALGKDNPDLENLRAFRDTTLAHSAVGRRITQIYYNNAGSINAALENSPALKAVARKFFETAALVVGSMQEQGSAKK